MAAGLNTQGKLQITELDFDDIKSNLKTYLKYNMLNSQG